LVGALAGAVYAVVRSRARRGIATALQRYMPAGYIEQAAKTMRLKTPEQGAATSVLLAAHPSLEGVGGRYYENCAESPVVDHRSADPNAVGVAAYALDSDNSDRLWELSERLLGAHVK